jgi:calreticulin
MKCTLAVVAALVAVSSAALYQEDFGDNFADRFVSSASKEGLGTFVSSAGDYYNDAEADKGIKTSEDAKFYGLIGAIEPSFSNEGKKLIISFRVKHEQNIDCGGGYIKLFPSSDDLANLDLESYNIMFGPDICGPGTRKVHVIFNYKGKHHLIKKTVSCKTDEVSHLYTLIVNPDNTYEVQIDGEKEESGELTEDFDFLPPKEINDPEQSKPEDWVDEKEIDDPEDSKPEDWVDEKQIVDPEAEQPEDWDEEMDGEWEAPMIDNPEYKGEYTIKRIENPEYKGEWEHPQIANPEYSADDTIYSFKDFGAIGFDLWQVKSGTIFDSVLITDDDTEYATAVEAFKTLQTGENKMKEEAEAAKKAEEDAKKAEEEAKKAEENEAADDEAEEEEEPQKDEL